MITNDIRYTFLRFPGGKPKAVTFSYDDGRKEDLQLAQRLNHYGMKCTFNINYDFIAKTEDDVYMNTEELRKLADDGHEIAIHGANHKAPGMVRPIEGIRDALECRMGLEKELGIFVRGFGYPDSAVHLFENGASYESVKHYLSELGIVYGRTLLADNNSFKLPDDWYSWKPTAIHTNPLLMDYIEEFISIDMNDRKKYLSWHRYPRLFYLWGHAYQFDEENNWDMLDTICEKLGGKEDTWYATNMEIYEYVTAYQSLVYSADGTMVYNPTFYTIWFEIDGKNYSIQPGETLRLS